MSQTATSEILALLNALSTNELSRLDRDLERAEKALIDLGQPDLGERLGLARESLRGGDVREFRRAVANVTARLGHLK